MLDFLLANGWNVVMPDGKISTTFLGRSDQQLSFLQVGRHVDPARFEAIYTAARASMAAQVSLPIRFECGDTYNSYYKFNLDYINLFNLIRLENDSPLFLSLYRSAYDVLRGCTGGDQNAHFNMIDRALTGPSADRDAATIDYLGRWLLRPRREYPTDLTGQYPACGPTRACAPIPVDRRPNTDFLWQRSPLLLSNVGTGRVETAGVDYILPYWMARQYSLLGS